MDTLETAAVLWEARPVRRPPEALGEPRWGVIHVPSGRWVAFGDEARCRRMVAHLIHADAVLGPLVDTETPWRGARP
jgi:hypothetical protein